MASQYHNSASPTSNVRFGVGTHTMPNDGYCITIFGSLGVVKFADGTVTDYNGLFFGDGTTIIGAFTEVEVISGDILAHRG